MPRDRDPSHPNRGGLQPVRGRNNEPAYARTRSLIHGGDHAADRANAPVQMKLPQNKHATVRALCNLPGGDQQRRGHRQVESVAHLRHVGRRKIDEDPQGRVCEAAVPDGDAYAVARFTDLAGREPDHIGPRDAGAQVNLNRDKLTAVADGSV